MQTLFPEPVWPAMRRCGSFARSVTIAPPATSFPSATVSFEGEREVVGERLDPRQLDPRRRFELVTGDDRPDENVDDRGRDPEMREGLLDDALVPDQLVLARPRRRSLIKRIQGGQNPRLFRRLRVQDAFGDDGGGCESSGRHRERLPSTVRRRLNFRGPPRDGGPAGGRGVLVA